MLRAFALAFIIALASCAHTSAEPPLNYTAVPASETGKHTRGDYDGDGLIDTADFFESNEGALTLIVRRAAAANEPTEIWGGDIASFPTSKSAAPALAAIAIYATSTAPTVAARHAKSHSHTTVS